MSARGPFFIPPHAVDRYRERSGRRVSYEQALEELIAICQRAHFVRHHENGDLWRTGKPGRWRLIIGSRHEGLPQLVTILSEHDRKTAP